MEYAIYVTLDKDLKKDFCILSCNEYNENVINLLIYTNGKSKIDFQKLNYLTFEEMHYKSFISFFSYGRKVISNSKHIHITNASKDKRNTKKDNEEILKFLNLNKEMLNKKLYIDAGNIKLTKDDLESLSPLSNCENVEVTLNGNNVYHYIDELQILYELVNEILKRINKYDFSPIEKMLYAYDIIRTNFMGNPIFEEKMEKILRRYNEPSYCYTLLYREVLNRLGIKNQYAVGEFPFYTKRAFNIVYVKDEDYDLEGVYYCDIANDSKQRIENALIDVDSEEPIQSKLINNYESFCKTKGSMFERGSLDEDLTFEDFGEGFMSVYNYELEKRGINGVFKLRKLINLVSNFIDDQNLIDPVKGIQDEEELDEIKSETERYTNLFSKDIEGEDFLEILFNVRSVEYMENKELFPLSIEALKECIYNSQFPLSNMMNEFSMDRTYEKEDIDEILQETFDNSFEEVSSNKNLEDRIRKIKLTLKKDINKPNNGDNK